MCAAFGQWHTNKVTINKNSTNATVFNSSGHLAYSTQLHLSRHAHYYISIQVYVYDVQMFFSRHDDVQMFFSRLESHVCETKSKSNLQPWTAHDYHLIATITGTYFGPRGAPGSSQITSNTSPRSSSRNVRCTFP